MGERGEVMTSHSHSVSLSGSHTVTLSLTPQSDSHSPTSQLGLSGPELDWTGTSCSVNTFGLMRIRTLTTTQPTFAGGERWALMYGIICFSL